MDLGLANKIAMVGGSSKGLGYAVAHALASEGASVSIASRDEAELRRSEHGLPKRADIAEHEQQSIAALGAERAEAVREARGRGGEFDEGEVLDPIAEDAQREAPAARFGEFALCFYDSGCLGLENRIAVIADLLGCVGLPIRQAA